MAVNINDVFQTTLTLLNKEQRGYVTPTEFNHVAGLVQNEVFEAYFQKAAAPDDMDSELSNIGQQYKEKLEPLITSVELAPVVGSTYQVPTDFYRSLEFYPRYEVDIPIKADRYNTMDANKVMLSPLTAPTKYNPIVVFKGQYTYEGVTADSFTISPQADITELLYIRRPSTPNWVGTTINGQLIPNTADSLYREFDLHISDYSEVVAKVLLYFGLNTRSDEVIQVAGGKEQQNGAI